MAQSIEIANVTLPLEYAVVKWLGQPNMEFVDPDGLDDAFVERLYQMYHPHYHADRDVFWHRMRNQIDTLTLFYPPKGHEVIGFNGLRMRRFELSDGTSAMTLYLGLAVIDPKWRGRLLVQRMVVRMFLELCWLHPKEPLYVWCDALTVRPFLVASRYLAEYYPSPYRETPDHIQELRRLLGTAYYGDTFDPERCVVQKAKRNVQSHEMKLHDLDDPLVRYYVECNPGHVDGEGLLIIQPATMENLAHFAKLLVRRKSKRLVANLRG